MKAHEMPWHSWNDDDFYVIDRSTDEVKQQIGCKSYSIAYVKELCKSNLSVFCGTGMEVKSQYLNKQ